MANSHINLASAENKHSKQSKFSITNKDFAISHTNLTNTDIKNSNPTPKDTISTNRTNKWATPPKTPPLQEFYSSSKPLQMVKA